MSNAYVILKVPRESDDEQIHAAYLSRLRECPPDRDPAQFERIRGAYEAIRTRRRRLAHALFQCQPPTLAELAEVGLAGGSPRRPDADLIRQVLSEPPLADSSAGNNQ